MMQSLTLDHSVTIIQTYACGLMREKNWIAHNRRDVREPTPLLDREMHYRRKAKTTNFMACGEMYLFQRQICNQSERVFILFGSKS